ncbi:MAG TPA: acyltransferase, partial [Gemmatimonadaceae bacterium]
MTAGWRPDRHFAPLDGLRGIAILLVLIHHFGAVMTPASHVDYLFLHVTGWAWVGVDLFFVLSGFLITGILLESIDDPRYYRTFYARRALRVFPLYYAFLLALSFIILPLIRLLAAHGVVSVGAEWLGNPVTRQPQIWLYLTNHLIAVRGFAAVPAFTAVFWSLAVEEQFYLVWPTVVRHMQREYLLWFAYAAIVVAFCFRVWIHFSGTWSPDAAYVLTLARMDALAVGAVIAMLVRRPDAVVRLRRW